MFVLLTIGLTTIDYNVAGDCCRAMSQAYAETHMFKVTHYRDEVGHEGFAVIAQRRR